VEYSRRQGWWESPRGCAWCLGRLGRPPAVYKPAAALRNDCGGAVREKRVASISAAGVGTTGGEDVCGSWDAAGGCLLCTSRRRLCGLVFVGRWGENKW